MEVIVLLPTWRYCHWLRVSDMTGMKRGQEKREGVISGVFLPAILLALEISYSHTDGQIRFQSNASADNQNTFKIPIKPSVWIKITKQVMHS